MGKSREAREGLQFGKAKGAVCLPCTTGEQDDPSADAIS